MDIEGIERHNCHMTGADKKRFFFWKHEFETMGTQQILHMVTEKYHSEIVLTTCFEPEGCLLLNMLTQFVREITIFCPATDELFPKVWKTSNFFHERFGVVLKHTDTLFDEFSNERKTCKFKLMLRGLRREHKPELAILEWDEEHGIPCIAPLARWKKQAVQQKLHFDYLTCSLPWQN